MKLVTRLAQKGRGRVTVNYHFHSLGLKRDKNLNFKTWCNGHLSITLFPIEQCSFPPIMNTVPAGKLGARDPVI